MANGGGELRRTDGCKLSLTVLNVGIEGIEWFIGGITLYIA